jgi:hypothetical protein
MYEMNKTAIVTCYYVDLHGTKFGGRHPRRDLHYKNSFGSLTKMKNVDFFIFCDPRSEEELSELKELYPDISIEIIPEDLNNFYMKDLFEKYKDFEKAKTSMRCQELQYLKTVWMNRIEEDYDYEYIYWFDMGISYSGLFPNKHMICKEGFDIEYYDFRVFTPELLEGLKKHSGDKFTIMAITNKWPLIYRKQIDLKFFPEGHVHKHHAIGGIIGGKAENVKWFYEEFKRESVDFILLSGTVEDEEVIYDIILNKNKEKFSTAYFDVWHHEDNNECMINGDYGDERAKAYEGAKPFYTVFEDWIELSKV